MSDTKPKAPRLQLRYEVDDERPSSWKCFYEIVVPLTQHDIRRERYNEETEETTREVEEAIASFPGYTRIGRSGTPCYNEDGSLFYDPPFRDSAHAMWDSAALNNLPIYCVTHDGKYVEMPADWAKG